MYLRGFSSILLLTVWFYCCYLGFFLCSLHWNGILLFLHQHLDKYKYKQCIHKCLRHLKFSLLILTVLFTPGLAFWFVVKQMLCSRSVCMFCLVSFAFTMHYCKTGQCTHPLRGLFTPFCHCLIYVVGRFALWDGVMTKTTCKDSNIQR